MLHDPLVVPLPVGHDRDGHGSPPPKLRRQPHRAIEHPLHQMAPLTVVAPVEPVRPQRPTQRRGGLEVARGERPRHGGPEVAVLPIEALHPLYLTGAPQLRMGLLRQRREGGRVPIPHLARPWAFVEQLEGVPPDRLEHPVAGRDPRRLRFGEHERFIRQPGEQVQNLPGVDIFRGADRLCRLQRPAPGEDRELPEQLLLRLRSRARSPTQGPP